MSASLSGIISHANGRYDQRRRFLICYSRGNPPLQMAAEKRGGAVCCVKLRETLK
jgi:hypothetical protein